MGGANIKDFTAMDSKNYTLTQRDKAYLMKIGYIDSDMPYIERAAGSMRYEHWKAHKAAGGTVHTEEKIDQERAVALVGKQAWLSGIARACFHASAVCETKGSRKGYSEVYFDNRAF